jgi:elongation factor P hydroxylase
MAHDSLSWLQDWYVSQCNGDWEHESGVGIGTLDDPGWSMEVDLTNTSLENAAFTKVAIKRSEHDWLFCEVVNRKFKAACGPRNLAEAIDTFRAWTEANAAPPAR